MWPILANYYIGERGRWPVIADAALTARSVADLTFPDGAIYLYQCKCLHINTAKEVPSLNIYTSSSIINRFSSIIGMPRYCMNETSESIDCHAAGMRLRLFSCIWHVGAMSPCADWDECLTRTWHRAPTRVDHMPNHIYHLRCDSHGKACSAACLAHPCMVVTLHPPMSAALNKLKEA